MNYGIHVVNNNYAFIRYRTWNKWCMGVLWMKIISLACINVVLINNNDYIFV